MIGSLVSIENGPARDMKIDVSPTAVRSEVSLPPGSVLAVSIACYEISGLQPHEKGLVTLTLVLTGGEKVRFYTTHSKFDMALLLDELDGTIGEKERKFPVNRRVSLALSRGWLVLLFGLGAATVTIAGNNYTGVLLAAIISAAVSAALLSYAYWRGGRIARIVSLLGAGPILFIVDDFMRRWPVPVFW